MANINRIILIVLDSVGVGCLPDASNYNDEGTNTLGHIFQYMGESFVLKNLAKLGLYNIVNSNYKEGNRVGSYAKMATKSPAKDTTAGHWELSGIILDRPFPTYPNGFPKDLIEEFENKIGLKVLGNCVASGTEIIKVLGDKHCQTGFPIVYTSADSVFQIAAHEQPKQNYKGLNDLYKFCEIARKMLVGKNAVGRVIARPFIGENGNYTRTSNRRDFSLDPIETTVLDKIIENNGEVVAIGKIHDIFNDRGITFSYKTKNNANGIDVTLDAIKKHTNEKTLIFTNLVDFDMLWGHRRNIVDYANGLKYFDDNLPKIIDSMKEDDLLIITADHGCDPTYTKHTDHTREYVPLLLYSKNIKQNINLGIRSTLADVAQTIADIFKIGTMKNGTSFKGDIL